jgi:hypothetical protein
MPPLARGTAPALFFVAWSCGVRMAGMANIDWIHAGRRPSIGLFLAGVLSPSAFVPHGGS